MTSAAFDARFRAAHAALTTASVTGTNGKTTTASMIAAIVEAAGEPSARVTTVGAWVGGVRVEAPDPTREFLACVEAAVDAGVRTIALEMTSQALGDGMARKWPSRVGVFTNLTRDHLDAHGTPEAYLASKAQLFLGLEPGGVAVMNGDDPATELICELLDPAREVRRFSLRDPSAALAARRVDVSDRGTRVSLAPGALAGRLGGGLELAAVGDVHAQNALAAALAADALDYPADAILRGLAGFAGVTGRFHIVGRRPLVVVDYAHTPDGLRGTLATARRLIADGGQLVCVFGCGGERDRGKRPQMGAVVHAHADRAWLTNDNPRREDPAAIAADVRAGIQGSGAAWTVELDRAAAIAGAVAGAGAADVVVVAGKGHEAEQIIGTERIAMSDIELAAAAWRRRYGSTAVT